VPTAIISSKVVHSHERRHLIMARPVDQLPVGRNPDLDFRPRNVDSSIVHWTPSFPRLARRQWRRPGRFRFGSDQCLAPASHPFAGSSHSTGGGWFHDAFFDVSCWPLHFTVNSGPRIFGLQPHFVYCHNLNHRWPMNQSVCLLVAFDTWIESI